MLTFLATVAAPLIAAASNQKIFFAQLGAASIQERPLIKKHFSGNSRPSSIKLHTNLATFPLFSPDISLTLDKTGSNAL